MGRRLLIFGNDDRRTIVRIIHILHLYLSQMMNLFLSNDVFDFRFPGESDIDQLFQIVRILGKLSSRHQILIMRNAMFRGMKQEQNTSLIQMFPNWNRDSIDFLSQCLKMDSNGRPDTAKLLKHDLFARDNFLDNFLSELRTKLVQEMQVNPLLKRIPSYGSKNRWNNNNDEKKAAAAAVKSHTTNGGASGNSIKSTTNSLSSSQLKSSGDEKKKKMETKSNANSNGKINLSVLSTQLLQPVAVKPLQQPPTNNPTNESYSKSNSNSNLNSTNAQQQNSRTNYANNDTNNMVNINDDLTTNLAGNQRNSDESNRTTAQKQRNNNNNDENSNNLNEAANNKQTSVNNSTMTATATTTTMTTTTVAAQQFKDMQKYPIVLSAKLQSKTGDKNHYSNGITPNSNQFDFQFQPPSPIPPFQSLQTEITQLPSTELVATLLQNKRLSPAVSHMAANNLIHNSNNSNINNSFLLGGQQSLPQYFNFRRHSNVLGVADQSTNILLPKQGNQQFMNKPPSFAINPTFTTNSLHFNTRNGGAGIMIKRERDRDRSQNLIEATLKPLNGSNFQNSILNSTSIVADGNSQNASKEPSPRLLPPPQWLTGNLKMTSIHGKNSTQIGAATNAINVNGNSKRRITDWKSVGMNNAAAGPKQCTDNNNTSNSNCNIDFVLPNCPGATVSPKKSSNNNGNSTSNNNLKKKLSSLSNVTQHHHHHLHHPELSQHALITPVSWGHFSIPFHSIQ